jgi:hypothetical protein
MISQQSTDKTINNENNPNNAIKKENDLKESKTIDEKTLLKEKISLLPSDQKEILCSIENGLQNIDMQQITIENQSINICDKISKYRILIIEEIFQLIYGINHFNPKVEYLCLINEIMKRNFGIEKNESDYNNIIQTMKEKFYPYIKGICVDLFWGLDKYNQDAVYYYLNEWDKNKYIKNEFIKEIKFELKMRNDPQITGNKEELNFLVNFVNYSGFKIEPSLIDFSKQTETLDRTKDNKQRKIMLKMEKDLIQKQLRMYNTHIQQLKEVNLLLNKIKENPNLLAEKQ